MKTLSRWWVFVAFNVCVLGFGAWLHSANLAYALPYLEEFDEARIFWNAYAQRINQPEMMDLLGYPPAIYALSMGAQAFVEVQTRRPAEFDMGQVVWLMRALALCMNVLTAWVLGRCVAWFGGRWWGVVASAGWLWASALIPHTVTALTEAHQAFLLVFSAYLALRALEAKRVLPALLSVAVALLGVTFKYSLFPALGFGAAVALWHARTDVRRWGVALAVQAMLIAGVAWVLFVPYNVAENLGIANSIGQRAGALSLDWELFTQIFSVAMAQIALSPVVWASVVGVGMMALGWRASARVRAMSALWVFIGVFSVWFITRYLFFDLEIPRYTTPFSPLLVGAFVIALAGLANVSPRAKHLLTPLLLAGVTLGWLLPQAQTSLAFAEVRTRPHTSAEMARWAVDVVQTQTTVLIHHTMNYSWQGQRIFSRDRGGWTGDKWLFWTVEDFDTRPTQDWARDGVGFFLDDAPAPRDNPDLLLLRTFPPPDATQAWQGPATLRLYRLGGMGVRADALFAGSVRLIGYDLGAQQLQAGDTLRITPYWQAIAPPQDNANAFFHLVAMDNETPLAQADGTPSSYRNRPTLTWQTPDEVHVGQTFTLAMPADIPTGTYRVLVGLYNYETGERLQEASGQTFFTLAQIVVTP